MTLFFLSYIAGVLTVAAPCILPLLPVVIGGSIGPKPSAGSWRKPVIITLSLALSVIIFTLLLKASTVLLGVPQTVWQILSGGIVALVGASLLWPKLWELAALRLQLQQRTNQGVQAATKAAGTKRDILLGVALGPVFSSCSPTYALIVAAVLPESFAWGFVYLIAYALGLASVLLLVGLAGQQIAQKLKWISNPHGWFRRGTGIIFIIVGTAVIFGWDKDFQAYVLEQGWYDPIMKLEQSL